VDQGQCSPALQQCFGSSTLRDESGTYKTFSHCGAAKSGLATQDALPPPSADAILLPVSPRLHRLHHHRQQQDMPNHCLPRARGVLFHHNAAPLVQGATHPPTALPDMGAPPPPPPPLLPLCLLNSVTACAVCSLLTLLQLPYCCSVAALLLCCSAGCGQRLAHHSSLAAADADRLPAQDTPSGTRPV